MKKSITDRPTDHGSSLRALARRLGCSHSSLSEQIHAGYLTRGRAIVTDIEAAVAAWNGRPAVTAAVPEHDIGTDWDALDVLTFALVVEALAREPAREFVTQIGARLRGLVARHYADDALADAALVLFAERVADAVEAKL